MDPGSALRISEDRNHITTRPTHFGKIKALLGMLARLPWGRRDVLGSTNGKYEGVSVKYTSLIVSCHWIKVFITA